jgi:hypothetical protein
VSETFTCPVCERVSHNPTDRAHRYCGACHLYVDDIEVDHIHCARCGRMAKTFWLNGGRGMIPRREITLVADSVFHTACWDATVAEHPPL